MKTTLWFLTLATAFGVVGTCEAGDEAARKTPAVFESSLGVGFARVPGTTTLLAVWKTRVKDYQVFLDATGGTGTKPEFEQTPHRSGGQCDLGRGHGVLPMADGPRTAGRGA